MAPDPDRADDANLHGADDGEEDEGHDHHHEPDRALLAALKVELAALTSADLDLHLAAGDMAYRTEVMRTLKVKLNPMFLKTGMGRLLRPQGGLQYRLLYLFGIPPWYQMAKLPVREQIKSLFE